MTRLIQPKHKPVLYLNQRTPKINKHLSFSDKRAALAGLNYYETKPNYHVQSHALLKKYMRNFFMAELNTYTLSRAMGLKKSGGMQFEQMAGTSIERASLLGEIMSTKWASIRPGAAEAVCEWLTEHPLRVPRPDQLMELFLGYLGVVGAAYTPEDFLEYALSVLYASFEKPISTRKQKAIILEDDYLSVVARIALHTLERDQEIATPEIQYFMAGRFNVLPPKIFPAPEYILARENKGVLQARTLQSVIKYEEYVDGCKKD